MTCFSVKHPRPKSLSDPFHDNSPELLEQLLQMPDELLGRPEFKLILGPHLPAGTYEESVYFLPLVCDYILAHDEDALDLISSIVWFSSEYATRLEVDGNLEDVRRLIARCLEHWTADFAVVHYDLNACQAKGWRLSYRNIVTNAETVAEATSELVEFEKHADLAIAFFEQLTSPSASAVNAAWYLELARQIADDDVRTPPNHDRVLTLLEDKSMAERSARLVSELLPGFATFPSYWRDTFESLAIESVEPPALRNSPDSWGGGA